jgi:cytochrome c6
MEMNKGPVFFSLLAWVCFLAIAGCARQTGNSGEALFTQHCAACHPKGGNTINPQKTLHAKDLTANNIITPGDIVQKIRIPGVGMPRFDRNVILDRDAKKIARYILTTFK